MRGVATQGSYPEIPDRSNRRRTRGDAVDAHGNCRHGESVSKAKKVKPAESAPTPGTVMGEKIRARANKLSDTEREALMGDAMLFICSSQADLEIRI